MATKQKIFSRSLIHSQKFWDLPSDKERLFFILIQLDLDNIGRGLGNKYYLKGKLYEKDNSITADDCEKHLIKCHEKCILIKYEIDGVLYIQDPVHLEHNKIIGNMKAESIYPFPPQEVIEEWQTKTNRIYTLSNLIKQSLSEDEDKDKEEDKDKYIEFVYLTKPEYQALIKNLGISKATYLIENLNNYIGSKGKRYKSHYHTILNWARRDGAGKDGIHLTKAQAHTKRGIESFAEENNVR